MFYGCLLNNVITIIIHVIMRQNGSKSSSFEDMYLCLYSDCARTQQFRIFSDI